jgi:hypothetical protein
MGVGGIVGEEINDFRMRRSFLHLRWLKTGSASSQGRHLNI